MTLQWHYNHSSRMQSNLTPDHSYLKGYEQNFWRDLLSHRVKCKITHREFDENLLLWEDKDKGDILAFIVLCRHPQTLPRSRNCPSKPLYVASTFDFRIIHTIIPLTYFPIPKFLKIEATIFPVSSLCYGQNRFWIRGEGWWRMDSFIVTSAQSPFVTVDEISPVSQSPN